MTLLSNDHYLYRIWHVVHAAKKMIAALEKATREIESAIGGNHSRG
jgi:hypothetical protein